MIYWIALLIWMISIFILVIFKKCNSDKKYLLIISQVYNFITGFLGCVIFYILTIFAVKYLGNITNIYLCYIFSIIPLLLLFLPLNIKVKNKVNMNTINYSILSIFITILGFCMFVFISNLM